MSLIIHHDAYMISQLSCHSKGCYYRSRTDIEAHSTDVLTEDPYFSVWLLITEASKWGILVQNTLCATIVQYPYGVVLCLAAYCFGEIRELASVFTVVAAQQIHIKFSVSSGVLWSWFHELYSKGPPDWLIRRPGASLFLCHH